MQYSICHIPPKKREIIIKLRDLQTHKSIWEQFEYQANNPALQ